MESTVFRPTFHRHTAQSAADRSIPRSMACRHTPSLTMFFEIVSNERLYHNVDKPMNGNCKRAGNIIFAKWICGNKNVHPKQWFATQPIKTHYNNITIITSNIELRKLFKQTIVGTLFWVRATILPSKNWKHVRFKNDCHANVFTSKSKNTNSTTHHIGEFGWLSMFASFLFVGGPSFSKDIEPRNLKYLSVQLIVYAKTVNYFFLFQDAWVSGPGQSDLQSAIQRWQANTCHLL